MPGNCSEQIRTLLEGTEEVQFQARDRTERSAWVERVQQTRSQPRHSNDSGLAESKNGWVIRKHIGWGQIGAAHAGAFDHFCRQPPSPSWTSRPASSATPQPPWACSRPNRP